MIKFSKNKNGKKGFTLIEILLYAGISSIILLAVSVFFHAIIQSRVKNQVVSEVDQQGLQVMQIITQTIRNAEGVTSPGVGNSSDSASLDVSDSAADPTVFEIAGGKMTVVEGSNSAIELTNSRVIVSNLSFSNLSRSGTSGIIRIKFTITHLNPEGRNEFDYSREFYGSASLK